jgi:hypothetical protein
MRLNVENDEDHSFELEEEMMYISSSKFFLTSLSFVCLNKISQGKQSISGIQGRTILKTSTIKDAALIYKSNRNLIMHQI